MKGINKKKLDQVINSSDYRGINMFAPQSFFDDNQQSSKSEVCSRDNETPVPPLPKLDDYKHEVEEAIANG